MDLESIKELMALQQSAYKDATTILFDSLNRRIEDQNNKIYELQKSLEFSQEELRNAKTELSTCKKELANHTRQLDENKNEISKLSCQLSKQENYSRRNNIRIEGMEEEKTENWEQTQYKVTKLLKEKMKLENINVEFAHRINKKTNKQGPRTIVARLKHDTDKNTAMKNSHKLKGTNIFINEDLSEHTLNLRKEKLSELKAARASGKIAYFDKERLIIKNRGHGFENSRNTAAHRQDDDMSNRRVSTLVTVFDSSPIPINGHTPNTVNEAESSPVSSRLRIRSETNSS